MRVPGSPYRFAPRRVNLWAMAPTLLTRSAMRLVLPLFLVTPLLLVMTVGCKTVRPMANRGHDLLENPNRSAFVQFPAGFGAAVGYTFALPVSVVLLPWTAFESGSVETSQGYGDGKEEGDICVPWVLAPFDYGVGIGAALFGSPFDWLASPFRDPPAPPPYTVAETKEPCPSREDPALTFAVNPPQRPADGQ